MTLIWRIVLIAVLVVVADLLLLYVSLIGTLDVNMVQISGAVGAHMDHPTPETKRALDAAKREASLIQWRIRSEFGLVILVVTASGFFIAGRQFERHRRHRKLSIRSDHATVHT